MKTPAELAREAIHSWQEGDPFDGPDRQIVAAIEAAISQEHAQADARVAAEHDALVEAIAGQIDHWNTETHGDCECRTCSTLGELALAVRERIRTRGTK